MKELFRFGGNPSKREMTIAGIIGGICVILLWYLIAITGIISNKILPNPVDMLCSLPNLFSKHNLLGNIGYTVSLNILGYIIALAIAIPLGFIIGIYPFKNEKGSKNTTIDFHEIEIWIKGKIKKNLTIREQYDAKQNLDKINKILFSHVINNIYNDNMEMTLGFINGLSTCKMLGKMIVDNIFSYATEKELNKVFEKIAIEIILDIKDKNKYKNQFILFNGEYLLSSKLYPKIVNKFYSLIKSFYKEKEIKENEDLEKELINSIKHDLISFLKDLGIICPIKYYKIPWI